MLIDVDWERLQRESSTSISGSQPVSQPLELPVRPPVVDQPDNNSNAYSPSDFDEMDLDDPDGLDDGADMGIPLDEQLPDSPMDTSLMLSKLIAPKFDEEVSTPPLLTTMPCPIFVGSSPLSLKSAIKT